MENASKALLIAGGILLALLTINLLLFLSNSLSNMGLSQAEKEIAQQIVAFNSEYEAYRKKIMYGTDVITVVNKAIENNRNTDVDEPHFVNVEFTVKDVFETVTVTTIIRPNEANERKVETSPGKLTSGRTYKLGEIKKGNEKFDIDKNTLMFFQGNDTNFFSKNTDDPNKIIETQIYSGLASFKKAIFTCIDMEYSDVTGKIELIKFEQLKDADFMKE